MGGATLTPKLGSTVWETSDPARIRHVEGNPYDALVLADGEFVIGSHNGYRTIGRMTGRTRRFFGIDCPTIERFEIETFAEDGVVLGRAAERIVGTCAIRPERCDTHV